MKEYSREKIRNIALISPHGSGKTSLAEAILYLGGATEKLGRVDDGSSILDYEAEEQSRGMSINSSVAFFDWNDHLVNVIDTPGFTNFLFETESALRVTDSALFVMSGIAGVKAQNLKFWRMAVDAGVPRIVFINKLDKERSAFEEAISELEEELGIKLLPLTLPIGKEESFRGIIDLVEMKAYLYERDKKYTAQDVPADMKKKALEWREKIVESVAEMNDELLEKYLGGEELETTLIYKMLREGVISGEIVPVLCGSSLKLIGVSFLLDAVGRYLPSPLDRPIVRGRGLKEEEGEEVKGVPRTDAPFSALVFKTIVDPYAGKISIIRVFSGSLQSDSTIYNSTKGSREKIGQVYRMMGKKQTPISPALFGDIVALAKLKEVGTGDTLCIESDPVLIPAVQLPQATISYAIQPRTRADEDKLMTSLNRIREEDPTVQFKREEETREFLLSGTGQTHVEITVEKLKNKYGVNVEMRTPKVPYKETIRTSAKAEGKYIKQTGGRGQYGDAWIEIEPLPRGEGYEFMDKIVGGVIPRNFIPSVEKGVKEAMQHGVLTGYPVVDIRVSLFDGKYHSVDSSDIAFKIAGSLAFKKAMEGAKPVLLEPIMSVETFTPDDCLGDVIGDINSKRGRVVAVETQSGSHVVKSFIPMAEILSYSPELRSITSGRGTFTMEFSHYEEVPDHVAAKIVEAAQKEKKAEEEK